MKKSVYLMLDVGGTGIKGGVLSENGSLLTDSLLEFDAHSAGTADIIFENLVEILDTLLDQEECADSVRGIGLAFPGPFDYPAGISRMRGIGKYDAIYGMSIREELRKRFPAARHARFLHTDLPIPILFLHDIEAFALGETAFGWAKGHDRVMYLCIGTGAGSAFTVSGQIVKDGTQVPENGWIYNTPYRESQIDDYLSVRGLKKLSLELCGEEKSGFELSQAAGRGDVHAMQAFTAFGEWLCEAMGQFLDTFQPDAFVLGGQIAKSFCYFGQAFSDECKKRGILLYTTSDTSKRTLQGLYAGMRNNKE